MNRIHMSKAITLLLSLLLILTVTVQGTLCFIVTDSGPVRNTFIPYSAVPEPAVPDRITVTGTKVLEGRDWQDGDAFSLMLEYDGGNGSWKTLATKDAVQGAPTVDFSEEVHALSFNSAGTYAFRMTEIKGDTEHITYDTTVNAFSIVVGNADEDNKLEIQTVSGTQNAMVTENNGRFSVAVTFTNTYTEPSPVLPDDLTVTVAVNKTVHNTGDEHIGPADFTFLLNDGTTERTAITDENGAAAFTLTFTHEDIGKTYTYTVREVNDGKENVLYSDKVYTIEITVSQDAETGKLIATATIDGTPADTIAVSFENVYDTAIPSAPTGDHAPIAAAGLLLLSAAVLFGYRKHLRSAQA